MSIYLKNRYNIAYVSWGTFTLLSIPCMLLLLFEEVRAIGIVVYVLQMLMFIFSLWLGNYMFRKECVLYSNNYNDPNKNICMLAVFDHLELSDKVKFLHTTLDGVELAKTKFHLLEGHNCYVGDVLKLKGLYLTFVKDHVILIENGKVVVDTASKSVMEKTVNVYKLINKGLS